MPLSAQRAVPLRPDQHYVRQTQDPSRPVSAAARVDERSQVEPERPRHASKGLGSCAADEDRDVNQAALQELQYRTRSLGVAFTA
jgi:hypothetical protein